MKIKLLVLTLFTASITFSQEFEGYLVLGFQGSQIDGDGMGGYFKPGLKSGIGLTIPGEKIDFISEITFSREGSRSSLNQTPYLIEFTSNYIDLTLQGKYTLTPSFNIYFGGQIGYLISASNNNSGSITNFIGVLRKFDLPYDIGVGYKLNESLEFMIRQSRSILTTRNDRFPFRNNNLGALIKLYI